MDRAALPACIAGIGHTELAPRLDRSAWELQAEAVRAAVADAGLEPRDVDGLLAEAGYSQPVVDGITPHFLRLGSMLGLDPRYTGTEVLGGASPVAMVQRAAMAVAAGLCEVCVCVFGDAPSRAPGTWSYGRGEDAAFGFFGAVGLHALAAQRHMALYETSPEQLGAVAVTFRRHAQLTPHAQAKAPLRLEDYLAAPYVAEPLRTADCCLISDGAGAVVVTSRLRARDLRHPPVLVAGFGQAHDLAGFANADYLAGLAAARSARTAFAQIYDCFTIAVLLQLEACGFCPRGEGGPFAASGALALGGTLPTNTAGGLLSEGFGGGMFHIIEAVRQLRGHCGERQVSGAEIALVTGYGLGMNAHATLVLGRESMPQSERPLPRPDELSRPFWQGCARSELLFQQCARCAHRWLPASVVCPRCWSADVQWQPARGLGTVFSFAVYHRAYHPAFRSALPYTVAVIELEEGPRLVCNVVGIAPERVAIGMRVRVEFAPTGDADIPALPVFRPLREGS